MPGRNGLVSGAPEVAPPPDNSFGGAVDPREAPGVPLTDQDLRDFERDGYLVVPGVVPEPLLVAADAEIDGLVDDTDPQEGDGGPGVNSWFMPRERLPRCEALLRDSPALGLANELVAPNELDFAFDHVQVSTTRAPWPHVPGGPHIDGHGPDFDPPASFTLLVGVLLTDQTGDQAGNLWVWPGSHLAHQRLFQERGTRVLVDAYGHSTLIASPPSLGAPVPLRGRRGDIVVAHFLLGHNKGGHTGPTDRRTTYYRLAVPGHPQRWDETFLDRWLEYPPVRRLAPEP
jgi:hypothetical protein